MLFYLTRKKKGEYLYDLLVIPPTWRLFSGTCVCVCFFFRKSCFRFRSFARARAGSRRFSRADLILQGGASCAADADGGREGGEGFTDPPSDGVNDYSRTSCYFPAPVWKSIATFSLATAANRWGSGGARGSSLDGGRKRGYLRRAFSWYCGSRDLLCQRGNIPAPGGPVPPGACVSSGAAHRDVIGAMYPCNARTPSPCFCAYR